MEPTGRDVGPFRGVTTVRVHGGFEICTGTDGDGRAVTVLTMGPSAAEDDALRGALADAYRWLSENPGPTDGEFVGVELEAEQPWVAAHDEPGNLGVRRMFERLVSSTRPPAPGHHTGRPPKITGGEQPASGPARRDAGRPPAASPPPPPQVASPPPPVVSPPPPPAGQAPPPQPAAGPPPLQNGIPTGSFPPVPPPVNHPTHQTGPLPRTRPQPMGPPAQPVGPPPGPHTTGNLPRLGPDGMPVRQPAGPPPGPHNTGNLPRLGPDGRPVQPSAPPPPGPHNTGNLPRLGPDGMPVRQAGGQPYALPPPPAPMQPYQGPVYSAAPRPIAPSSAMPAGRSEERSRITVIVLIAAVVGLVVLVGCLLLGYLLNIV